MTDQADRYDRIAAGYAQWWAPVLEPRATALLDRIPARLTAGTTRIVDVGTGTGTLARAALRRWSAATVIGVDVSSGMAAAADGEADRLLEPSERARFETRVAPADDLPLPDASVDMAISSFVFQLVPNRYRALREARRVVRPGGMLAWVTWLVDQRRFAPDEAFDDLLDEIGVGAREPETRSGDVPTAAGAGAQMRRAGFHEVTIEQATLEYQFTIDGYIRFLAEFDEEDLISSLTRREREQVLGGLRECLGAMPPSDLALRYPIVYVTGLRP